MRLQTDTPLVQRARHSPPSWFARLGVALGALALILAVIQFWAGPFAVQASNEQVAAERAAALVEGTLARLRGEQAPATQAHSRWNIDRVLSLIVSITATLAITLGAVGLTQAGGRAQALAGVLLGLWAIAFQFAGFALGVLLVFLLLGALLSVVGIG